MMVGEWFSYRHVTVLTVLSNYFQQVGKLKYTVSRDDTSS